MAISMRLAAARVFVSDVAGAAAFYRDQVGLEPHEIRPDEGYAVFALAGGGALVLEEDTPDEEAADGLVGRLVGVSLAVDDLDAAYETLSGEGVRFLGPPEEQPWGGRTADFCDPDDNILTLVELRKP
jgi:predicted enzyme related to lactoylglutathione lyase